MALGVTSKGVATANSNSVSISSLTIAASSTLVLVGSIGFLVNSAVYNDGTDNQNLTERVTEIFSGRSESIIYSLDNANVATGSGSVTLNLSGTDDQIIALYEVTGADSAGSFDKSASAQDRSTTPDSGTTVTTAQADEIVIGTIGYDNGADPGGTYNGTCTDNGQEGGIGDRYLDAAVKIVTITGTYNISKSGGSKEYWTAAVATFKAAAAAAGFLTGVTFREY